MQNIGWSIPLSIYEKIIFLVVFVSFAWLLSIHEISFFLFLLRYMLLILDLSSEATTRGVL